MKFIKSWRWFGEHDSVELSWLKEKGIEDVATGEEKRIGEPDLFLPELDALDHFLEFDHGHQAPEERNGPDEAGDRSRHQELCIQFVRRSRAAQHPRGRRHQSTTRD